MTSRTTKRELSNQERLQLADPAAVDTAQEMALLLPNETVILFGSRARGDHRPDSDIDLLILTGTKIGHSNPPSFQAARNQAVANVYGTSPHPEVQLVPMHPSTYQRTKRSRNFLAGHIAAEVIAVSGNSEKWLREPGDHSHEPLFARQSATDALRDTTTLGEWRTHCPELTDDQVLQARSCLIHAHAAVASQAGLTIRRHEKLNSVRSSIKRQGWNLPETEIPLREYNWYDNHSFSTIPPVVFHPTITAAVRRDVQNVLATSPTLHTDAKKRWERWKRSRSNQARSPRARE